MDKRGWIEDSHSRIDEETKIADGDHPGYETNNNSLLFANNSTHFKNSEVHNKSLM